MLKLIALTDRGKSGRDQERILSRMIKKRRETGQMCVMSIKRGRYLGRTKKVMVPIAKIHAVLGQGVNRYN